MQKGGPNPESMSASHPVAACESAGHTHHAQETKAPPPTEPCPICHEVVGLETCDGFVEEWVSLPCEHRFGNRCAKVWLGMNIGAVCPVCQRKMVHICGHPALPRSSMPPIFDERDIQPGQDRPAERPGDAAPVETEPAGPEDAVSGGRIEIQSGSEGKGGVATDHADDEANDSTGRHDSGRARSNMAVWAARRVRCLGTSLCDSRVGEKLGSEAVTREPRTTPSHRRRKHSPIRMPRFPLKKTNSKTQAAPAEANANASTSPARRVPSHTAVLEILASMSDAQRNKVPNFLDAAYPKKLDLDLPCPYCFIKMNGEPAGSPYRGEASRDGKNNKRFFPNGGLGRSAYDIMMATVTINHASRLVRRVLHKTAPPRSNDNVLDESPHWRLMSAYWDSWRQVQGKDFGQWWAEMEPQTEPAVHPPAEIWNLALMMR